MEARIAWVLNLDADVELAAFASGVRAYTPPARVLEAMRPHADRLADQLLAPGDVRIDETSGPGSARGMLGRAFCPTPRALALLARAGATPEPAPSIDILARVNGRAFATALGPTLPAAAFVTTEADALAKLATSPPPDLATAWRVKRAFGMSGRGQRVVTAGALTAADLALVRGGLSEGGVQIEPDVDVVTELGLHGFLDADGALTVGALVSQTCTSRGQWLATTRVEPDEPRATHAPTLHAQLECVAAALHREGYAGPFGVDAFTYRTRTGDLRLHPLSEINARYAMGFPTGYGRAPRPSG